MSLPLADIQLLRSFLQDDGAVDYMEIDFGVGAEPEPVANVLGNRYLSTFSNLHTYEYDSRFILGQ